MVLQKTVHPLEAVFPGPQMVLYAVWGLSA
jgi:hypothetical protein